MNVRGLAEALGVPTQRIYLWRGRDDWAFGKGPYDVAAVAAWRATFTRDRAPNRQDTPPVDDVDKVYPLIADTGDPALNDILKTMPPGKQAVVRKELERGKAVALQNLTTERGLVDRAEVEKGWTARVRVVRAALTALPRQVAGDCEGRGRADIERLLADAIERICRQFSEG